MEKSIINKNKSSEGSKKIFKDPFSQRVKDN